MSGGRSFRRRLGDLRAKRVLYLLPELEEGMHPALLDALERGKTSVATMAHESDCDASDAGIAALVERYGGST